MKLQDLEWEQHTHWADCKAAMHTFDNGYGVSVITGNNSAGGWLGPWASKGQYEVAILKDDYLCYDTDLTDDVLKYQSESDVNEVLKIVEAL